MRRARHRTRQTPSAGRVVFATGATALIAVGLLVLARPARTIERSQALPAAAARLVDLHAALPAAEPGDWREGPGSDERGQSYDQWRASEPRTALGTRKVLYVVVLGTLDPSRREVVERSVEFLGLYFGLEVRRLPDVAVDARWPAAAQREHGGRTQLLTQHVLNRVLAPRLPRDAAALLALTAHGLWPGRGWNFVFGMASLRGRVGVWSIARFGDPSRDKAHRLRCLRRTLKVATHETGHMFGSEHCLAYACNMCGSNNMEETDRLPLWLCPECLPKLWDATGVDPAQRFARLARFARGNGMLEEAAFYAASHARLARER